MAAKLTRISIDIPVKEHKRIKVIAASEGVTLCEFVLRCIHERIYPPKIPNVKTRRAIALAQKKKLQKQQILTTSATS